MCALIALAAILCFPGAASASDNWTYGAAAFTSQHGGEPVKLDDGDVLMAGAYDAGNHAASTAELYTTGVTLDGTVYDDANGNGVRDTGESGHAGVIVTLYSGLGFGQVNEQLTATTDADGGYSFPDVAPAEENWLHMRPPSGTVGTTLGIVGLPHLGSGYVQDFGISPAPALATVFADDFTDADGTTLVAHDNGWTAEQSMPVIQGNALTFPGGADPVGLPALLLTDQCLSFDVRFPTAGIVALHVRQQHATPFGGTGYGSDLNTIAEHPNYNFISLYKDGGYFNNGTNPPKAVFGTDPHRVKLCAIGGQLRSYVDDTLTNAATDAAYAQGYLSLGISAGNVIDNVKIEGLQAQTRQLTALGSPRIWIGLKNSDDVGVKFDLLAEVYRDSTLVASGQLNSFGGGSSGFNNAHLATVTLAPFTPVSFPPGSQLKLRVSVRNACTGSRHNSGVARLWYNDAAANSGLSATIDAQATYYLRDTALLALTVGPGPKKTTDIQSGAKCSAFKPFGTWTVTP
ncbi:SdrD B-like domain-containing protein [Nonomuraea endophytica]|uniref:SD-repeat containing protein B domain-containing protein n=1 Tax=Nonomuraea endophytica TaxID=714136 RepID=A0A7W7ZZY4_9ACTN|nr:SdrD B-like domain-containing protein [Nonomuraea endophytica]MBB5076355.1 hypothetical protein [Nonomuraea endophytica]